MNKRTSLLTILLCKGQRNYSKARYEPQILYHESYIRFHRKDKNYEASYHSLTFKSIFHSLKI